MGTSGHPTTQPYSRAGLLAKLTGAATLAAGALLYGQATSQLATLTLGTAGRVLVAGASAPAWSDAGLSYASGVLAIAGSAPGTPSAGQVLIGGGAIKAGGAISGTTVTASSVIQGTTTNANYGLRLSAASGKVDFFPWYDSTLGAYTISTNVAGDTYQPMSWQASAYNFYNGAATFAAAVSVGGDITVANTGGGASAALTAGSFGQMLKWQRYGYSTSYTALQIGNATYGLSFGYDHSPNGGGQFYGDNRDIFFRRGAHIGCANAGGTDFVWALRISGGATSNGAHILELTDDVASFLGNAPGTPGATEVLIGAGQVKAGAAISCAGLTSSDTIFSSNGTVQTIMSYGATYGTIGTNSAHDLYLIRGGSQKATLSASAFNLSSGVALQINGTQVVGAQGAAIADATDAASTMARLNDLLGSCRSHGLIAT